MNYRNLVKHSAGSEIPVLAQVSIFGKIGTIPENLKFYRRHSESVYHKEQKNIKKKYFAFWNKLNIMSVLILIVLEARLPFGDKMKLVFKNIHTILLLFIDLLKTLIISIKGSVNSRKAEKLISP